VVVVFSDGRYPEEFKTKQVTILSHFEAWQCKSNNEKKLWGKIVTLSAVSNTYRFSFCGVF